MLWFPRSCASRAGIQEGGLRAGHPPHQLLKAGACPCTQAPLPHHLVNMACVFVGKSHPVCLCSHIPTQKVKMRIPSSLPREQWKVFVYVCDSQERRITNAWFDAALGKGGDLGR